MQTKIEFVLTQREAEQLVPGFHEQAASLASALIEDLGLNSERGGWVCKVTRIKDSNDVKVTGKLVPPGGAVLA